MVHYRRCKIAGGTYFFTATLKNRNTTYLIDHIDHFKSAISEVKTSMPYKSKAMVVLPEHLHALWELPPNDCNYEARWRRIKSLFTQKLIKQGIPLQKNLRGQYDLWQSRFWEHFIRDNQDYRAHVDYIHFNPVKHGLVNSVNDWPHSTFHEYVKRGFLSSDWGSNISHSVFVRE